ncbi:neurofilament medium polypeptide-like [Punica granatum]|uniref:Neurofilament medium polypeptide-like n=1 Tax=Punica granatum TaxID=22663 RepID=A0A6P8DUL3_PUNGR|nr:neurofilament medium polypeptide-like [Punica granatum]
MNQKTIHCPNFALLCVLPQHRKDRKSQIGIPHCHYCYFSSSDSTDYWKKFEPMGCGKSKLNAVATGNTTSRSSSSSSKRLNAAESSVAKSSSKKFKPALSKKSINMENLTQKVPNLIAADAAPERVLQTKEENKGGEKQGSGSMNESEDNVGAVAGVEVEAITKNPEPKGGEKKEMKKAEEAGQVANNGQKVVEGAAGALVGGDSEPKEEEKGETTKAEEAGGVANGQKGAEGAAGTSVVGDSQPKEEEKGETVKAKEAGGVANGEETVEGAAGTVIGGDLPNHSSDEEASKGVGSKGQPENNSPRHEMGKERNSGEIAKAAEDVEEKASVEKTKEDNPTEADKKEEKAPLEETKENNLINEAEQEAKAGEDKDSTPAQENGVTSAAEENKTA